MEFKEELEQTIKPLTDKVKELEGKLEEYKAKEVTRKVTNTPEEIKVISNPEDRLSHAKTGGFKNMPHFISELIEEGKTGKAPETLKAWDEAVTKAMSEGQLSAGGYLVPEQFGGVIEKRSLETSIVYPRADVISMTSNRVTFAASVDANHSSNYFGGITLYRPGEGGQKTATDPAYEEIALTLHKLTGLCHVSDELIQDSVIAVEQEIISKFSEAISFQMDYDFFNGTGVNQPLGIITSTNPSLITVTAETGQGAATIVAENVLKMWQRAYNKDSVVWIANHDTFTQLATMAVAVGSGGVAVWMPAGGLSGQPYQTLMGKPLLFTEKVSTLGTAGDIILADLKQYKVGVKGGLEVATSMHFKFDYDQQSFRFVMRYDGTPKWLTALTPKVSSETLSPFIVLNSTRT